MYHGNTLTASVPVRAVCVAIACYAFMASPYPLIISAEMHCGPQQQLVLVEILKQVFGDHLLTAELEHETYKSDGMSDFKNGLRRNHAVLSQLPSPEQLKYKILFKVRRRGFSNF